MDCSDRLRPLIVVSNIFFLDLCCMKYFHALKGTSIEHSANIRNIIEFLLRTSINDVQCCIDGKTIVFVEEVTIRHVGRMDWPRAYSKSSYLLHLF